MRSLDLILLYGSLRAKDAETSELGPQSLGTEVWMWPLGHPLPSLPSPRPEPLLRQLSSVAWESCC